MKNFSEDWINGCHTDELCSIVEAAYLARIKEITPQLSPELRRLTTNQINLHDGLIQRIVLDHGAQSLSIILRCGNLQVGYFDVELVYTDVDLNGLDPALLRAVATDPATELLYAEIDLEPSGRFVHRIIFWPRPMREIEVIFWGLTVSTEPRPDRNSGTRNGTYCESP